jgi:outer membrane protein OmpA-like peptidoglycan-associated protein
MYIRGVGVVGSLGLLLASGAVRAQESQHHGGARATECRDAGMTVSFAPGSHELDTNARGALDGIVTWLKASSERKLRLQGYADTTGSSVENLVLS